MRYALMSENAMETGFGDATMNVVRDGDLRELWARLTRSSHGSLCELPSPWFNTTVAAAQRAG